MIIFPAIDIKDGKCVRLLKGNFNKITSYDTSPIDQADVFFKSGFKDIHIVDLDGALLGESKNSEIIKEIIKKVKLRIQIGGGIRNIDSINNWLEIGVDKVVMGTAAVENIELLKNACSTGSPASTKSTKLIPLTTLPFFTSRQGMILFLSILN